MLSASQKPDRRARRIRVGGRVQGVGFRPFVYRLAVSLGLAGSVRNVLGEVEVRVEGPAKEIEDFAHRLVASAPPLARPAIARDEDAPPTGTQGFEILPSVADAEPRIHLPPDYFTCPDCLAEFRDPAARRYRYPFINCTQCGPRYTIIRALPYDRPATSMAGFPLCPECRKEYGNPRDRRFHAEPLACPACGPSLSFLSAQGRIGGSEAALDACLAALRNGGVVAVKGIGGYHLLCDATDEEAVRRLRVRKARPHKPLAVMFPPRGGDGLEAVRLAARVNAEAASLMLDPSRPIVLVPRREDTVLAPSVAPGLGDIGAFLPYSPLHHLLLDGFGGPLVATSGNVSGEPVLTTEADAERFLGKVADAFLHHNRPIVRPADDSVVRIIADQPCPVRLGRGLAPLELDLPVPVQEPVLALGGHLKVTVALGWEGRVVISPHISDLGTVRGQRVFEQVCDDLQALYGVQARRLLVDRHPDYASSRWARGQGLPVTAIWHHRAHASAVAAESPARRDWLVFAWDGVGFGEDHTLWGGETLYGRPGHWRRVASLRSFRLPGGDRAGRAPWRSAAALCWGAGQEPLLDVPGLDLARAAWLRGLNTPVSSAVGRVFDAAATLLTGLTEASFEGQGPMQLEALAGDAASVEPVSLPLEPDADGLLRLDWAPLLPMLQDTGRAPRERASCLHSSLAEAIGRQVEQLRVISTVDAVGLSGGVFQNRLLTERVCARLESSGLPVFLCTRVPANDGGLSYGQIVDFAGADG